MNSITPSGMAAHILRVGTILMLIRNMNLHSALVNNARMVEYGEMENPVYMDYLYLEGFEEAISFLSKE